MSWNIVFDTLMEIKKEYQDRFGEIVYDKKDSRTCVEQWIEKLNNSKYNEMFKPIQFSQHGNMVLVRYGSYATIFDGEDENTFEDFWYKYDGFYTECRSVVIDVKKEIVVLSPFKKFKNLNEGEENALENILSKIGNATTVEITNKLDGSMQSARYVEEYDSIIMSGSKALSPQESWRLEDGYKMLLSNKNYITMLQSNSNYTFIFEYISLADSHVVKYTKEQEGLYLIGMRDSATGEQFSYKDVKAIAERYDVLCTEIFNKDIDEVLQECKTVSSDKMEGFVINIDGHLVKAKADDYVNIHRVLSKISSPNLIIEYIAEDKYDDLISKVPQIYHDRVNAIANKISEYVYKYDKAVNDYCMRYKNVTENTKEFMIKVEQNVPQQLQGFVRNKFLGKEINYLKRGNQGYINFTEIERRLEWVSQN